MEFARNNGKKIQKGEGTRSKICSSSSEMALVVEYKDKRRQQERYGDIFTDCKEQMANLYIKIGRYYAKNFQHNGHVSTSQALYGWIFPIN